MEASNGRREGQKYIGCEDKATTAILWIFGFGLLVIRESQRYIIWSHEILMAARQTKPGQKYPYLGGFVVTPSINERAREIFEFSCGCH